MKATDRFNIDGVVCELGGRPLKVANLSISGLFAITDLALTVGQHVEMILHLPDRAPFRLTGLVSWTNDPASPRAPDLPQGLGIRITRIALPDKVTLLDLLKRTSPGAVRQRTVPGD
jgi:PilZ domain